MRKTGMAAVFAMALGCAIAAAQTTDAGRGGKDTSDGQTRTPTGTATTSPTAQSQTVMITGCVQADRSNGGSGTTTATRYSLTNARKGSNTGETTPSAGAATARVTAPGSTYMLDGTGLAQHVGHQVEVTGTMMASASGTSSSATGTSGITTGGGVATGGSATTTTTTPVNRGSETLRVTSVRSLGDSCAK